MLVTLCVLIALAKSKAKKKPASLQAFLYLAYDLDSNQGPND
ncbi:hypothetical protein [Pseudomonas sp. LH1G9]|nr:hypothetical protein [Pseudomonas sp. LH1G9]